MERNTDVFTDQDAISEMAAESQMVSYIGADSAFDPAMAKPLKRIGLPHMKLNTAGRQRSRTLSNSENAVPLTSSAFPAPTVPFGDITNVIQHSGSLPFGKQLSTTTKAKSEPQQAPALFTQAAASQAESTLPELEVDVSHADDPQHCVEYVQDIYENLRLEEMNLLPGSSFLQGQSQVNSKMRAILVDWLVDVHRKYKLQRSTLFLAVSLIDRFLEKRDTQRRNLQLVGVTALLIAAKYEEVYPPQINDFVYVTDKAYTKNDIIQMEVQMLAALEFSVCRPLSVTFLDRYQVVNGCTEEHQNLAHYILELTLVDYKMAKYSPSHLAAAALLLSNKLLHHQPSWTAAAAKHTKMTEPTLKECAKDMCGLVETVEQGQLQAVKKKYAKLNLKILQS